VANAQIENGEDEGLDILAKPTKRGSPVYPFEMRRAGKMGGAMIEFIVTSKGIVTEPRSVAETDPAFGEAAVDAVAKWKFKPGMKKGKPVNSSLVVPIYFTLSNSGPDDWGAKIRAVLTGFPSKTSPEVAEQFQYTTPPKALNIQSPVWPWIDGVPVRDGKADVFYVIDARGQVAQARIVSASNDVFGKAAQAAVESWRFEPALRDGKPVPALGRRDVQFKLYLPSDASELRQFYGIKKGTAEFAMANELDAALKPIKRKAPQYPMTLFQERPAGTATIECIIDRNGRVCLPRIIEASQEEFGWSAATAAASWRFTPPTVEGKPVDVLVRIPFDFQGRKK